MWQPPNPGRPRISKNLSQKNPMQPDPQRIIDDALQLEPAARALIAETLLETLDFEEDFPISQEWMDEIHRRCAAIDNGTDKLVDHDRVIQRLRGKYA